MAIGSRLAAVVLGTLLAIGISALAYDRYSPVYKGVSLANVRLDGSVIFGSLTFRKRRDCEPVKGSLVAFAHYVNVPQPVVFTDKIGDALVLRDLPAQPEPYTLPVGWRLSSSLPLPDSLSVTYRATCGVFTQRYTLGPFDIALDEPLVRR